MTSPPSRRRRSSGNEGRLCPPDMGGASNASGGFAFLWKKTNPPLACGSRPPCQGVKAMTDEDFMRRALELARRAQEEGEVPVGAVVVLEERMLGEGWNRPIAAADPSAHAEIQAMRAAATSRKNYRLVG